MSRDESTRRRDCKFEAVMAVVDNWVMCPSMNEEKGPRSARSSLDNDSISSVRLPESDGDKEFASGEDDGQFANVIYVTTRCMT